MERKDFEGRIIDMPGCDVEYIQEQARLLAKKYPGWLTEKRKISLGLEDETD